MVDIHVVVVYCFTGEDRGYVAEDSVGWWETRIEVSISSVRSNISPIVMSRREVLGTYKVSKQTVIACVFDGAAWSRQRVNSTFTRAASSVPVYMLLGILAIGLPEMVAVLWASR